jgi:hypothetical protein
MLGCDDTLGCDVRLVCDVALSLLSSVLRTQLQLPVGQFGKIS